VLATTCCLTETTTTAYCNPSVMGISLVERYPRLAVAEHGTSSMAITADQGTALVVDQAKGSVPVVSDLKR